MFFVKRINYLVALGAVLLFTALIIINPTVCKEGVINGILISGRIIIPSLFPFTMCVLFIMKTGILRHLSPLSPLTKCILGISAEKFSIFVLSLIGGFPVGARLINESCNRKEITETEGSIMLNYSINAGPAFIIGAVGNGIFASKKIGEILLLSHILAALTLCFLSRFFNTSQKKIPKNSPTKIALADNFVLSVTEAAASVFNICAFVVLFSSVNAYLKVLSLKFPFLKYLLLITEVTNGILQTDNVFVISFLLGFGGFCIWCQVISAAKSIKIKYPLFIAFRLLHGVLSVFFTKILLVFFDVSLPTFSSGTAFTAKMLYSTPSLAISMLTMSIIFMISISDKKYTSKILEDVI